jgi:hypothetical protein
MYLSRDTKEIIGRATLFCAGIAAAVAATWLLRAAYRVERMTADDGIADNLLVMRIALPLAIFLYLCAGGAICFTFCARDKRRSNPAAALRWAEGVRAFFEAWMSGRYR